MDVKNMFERFAFSQDLEVFNLAEELKTLQTEDDWKQLLKNKFEYFAKTKIAAEKDFSKVRIRLIKLYQVA